MKRTKKKNTLIDIAKLGEKSRRAMQAGHVLGTAFGLLRQTQTAFDQGQLTKTEHNALLAEVASRTMRECAEVKPGQPTKFVRGLALAEAGMTYHGFHPEVRANAAKNMIMLILGYCDYYELPVFEELQDELKSE